jgi:hypothetical protein
MKMDLVYCDASFFDSDRVCILAIVHGKEVTRIKAKAKNGTVAELLSILMAKKLYPGKPVVNDCKAVTDMFIERRYNSVVKLLGKNAQVGSLFDTVNTNGIIWQRRRTDEKSCMVDTATRRQLTDNYLYRIEKHGYTLREVCF